MIKLLMLLIPLDLMAAVGVTTQIQSCVTLNEGKYVVQPNSSFPTYNTCPSGETCTTLSSGFFCPTYSFYPKQTTTACSNISTTPEEATPTDPPDTSTDTSPPDNTIPVPTCDSVTCPSGQVRTETPISVTCSWQELELDPKKQSVWNQQDMEVTAVKQEYDESQLYWNLQGYCQYVFNKQCQTVTPTQKNKVRKTIESFYGEIPNAVKTRLGL